MTRNFLTHSEALFITLLLTGILTAHAADTPSSSTTISTSTDSTRVVKDTSMHVQPLSLLPEKLGPMESIMWSQHGVMRSVFDFPLTEEGRENEMHLRRTMLTMHEIGGFTTLAAMLATIYVGQMLYDQYPKPFSRNMDHLKSDLGWGTVFLYFGTASLSIFTPPPMVRHNEWSTVSTHKLLATIHFTGMILTPILASQITGKGAPGSGLTISRDAETAHLISAYVTTAAFLGAMVVITF